jgi:hypothetical protein
MIAIVLLAAAIVGGVLSGGAAHELAHFAAARLVGCPALLHKPRLRGGEIRPSVGVDLTGRSVWTTRAVALAPVALGVALAPIVLAVYLLPAIDPGLATPPLAIRGGVITAWVWTIKPGRDDLRRAFGSQLTRSTVVSY